MEIKTIVTVIIAGMLGAVVFAGLLPVFADTSSSETTFTNNGYFRMTHYDDSTDHVLTWSSETYKSVTVDDVVIPIDIGPDNQQVTLIADTNFLVRYNYSGNAATLTFVGPSGGTYTASSSSTITFTSGSVSAVMDSTTRTSTYTDIYLPSLDGPYSMNKANNTAYLNADSTVIGYGLTRLKDHTGANTPTPGYGFEFIGSYTDGVTSRVWRGTDVTLSDASFNADEVNTYRDLYKFNSITATATLEETVDEETFTTDTAVTYTYVLVPYEVTAEKVIHPDGPTAALLNLLPVLIAIGLIVGIAGAIFIKRM